MTDPLFQDDPYQKRCAAAVTGVTEDGGLILDRTVFYAAGADSLATPESCSGTAGAARSPWR